MTQLPGAFPAHRRYAANSLGFRVSDATAQLLLVDDDPELLQFLREELEGAGHGCIAVASGQDALLQLRQQAFALVVLDWGLPDFNGVEICRRLRSSGDTTPVLMLTAHDALEERVAALDAGADDFLTKPFKSSSAPAFFAMRAIVMNKPARPAAPAVAPAPVGPAATGGTSKLEPRGGGRPKAGQ